MAQPPQFVCPHCQQRGKKILLPLGAFHANSGQRVARCPQCGQSVTISLETYEQAEQRQVKQKQRTSLGCLGFVVLVILVIVIAVLASGGKQTYTHAQKVSAFNPFVGTINNGVNSCNVGGQDAQVLLGEILANPSAASESDLVQLDSAAKSAQTVCDDAKDQTLLNMETANVPGALAGESSLSNAPTQAGIWATDCGKVLHDLQNLAESSGNDTAILSQLSSDVSSADGDASTLDGMFQSAASDLGVSFKGFGLVQWSTAS
jgi:hypothetical protein